MPKLSLSLLLTFVILMQKNFKVAGHVFGFIMPEGHSLWQQLGQYAPFEVSGDEETLFTVEVVDSLPDLDMVKVYGGEEAPGEPQVLLYRAGEDWVYEMSIWAGHPVCGRMVSDSAFSKAKMLIINPKEALFALNNAAMLMFAFSTAGLNTLEMHASVIANGGKAYLFLAKSGTGKSTHSSLWLKNVPGSHLLNDDNPIVRVLEDGTVEAFGSPWSGKTPCYRNEHYPVGAFVQIRRCPENKITPLSVFEAYALIFSSSSGFKADPSMADGLHSTFEKIATTAHCYVLDCRPDDEAAMVCSNEVRKWK